MNRMLPLVFSKWGRACLVSVTLAMRFSSNVHLKSSSFRPLTVPRVPAPAFPMRMLRPPILPTVSSMVSWHCSVLVRSFTKQMVSVAPSFLKFSACFKEQRRTHCSHIISYLHSSATDCRTSSLLATSTSFL